MKTNPNHNVYPAVFDPNCQASGGKGFSTEYLHSLTTGITKREYFAAMAMQGYIAAGSSGMPYADEIVSRSVVAADALIDELNKKEKA